MNTATFDQFVETVAPHTLWSDRPTVFTPEQAWEAMGRGQIVHAYSPGEDRAEWLLTCAGNRPRVKQHFLGGTWSDAWPWAITREIFWDSR